MLWSSVILNVLAKLWDVNEKWAQNGRKERLKFIKYLYKLFINNNLPEWRNGIRWGLKIP